MPTQLWRLCIHGELVIANTHHLVSSYGDEERSLGTLERISFISIHSTICLGGFLVLF